MRKFSKIMVIVSLVTIHFFSGSAMANEVNAEGMIKYRKNVMKATKGHMGAIMDIMKNRLPLQSHIVVHAKAIHEGSKLTLDGYPEGSDFGDTRAKENIWSNWSKFEKAAQATTNASAELVKAAESGNMKSIAKKLQAMGKSCGGCHRNFREKD